MENRKLKRISERAWNALHDALCSYWYFKDNMRRWLAITLEEHPRLLAGIDFENDTKREASELIVDRLRRGEATYFDVTIDLLLQLSTFDDRFQEIERAERRYEQIGLVAAAQAALHEVQAVIADYGPEAERREQVLAEAEAAKEATKLRASHQAVLDQLKERYLELASSGKPHERGKALEGLLNDLFGLWDLDPNAEYSLDHEQIDGAFSFDTDDYLLEARWWNKPLEGKHVSYFKDNVEEKLKSTLGLCVSISGFTAGAKKKNSVSTSIIFADGTDLYNVLDGRIELPEMLKAKRQHAAKTGEPFLSSAKIVGDNT